MVSGFADDAQELLREAARRDAPHATVGTYLGRVAEVVEEEAGRKRDVLELGRDADRFARGYASARFASGEPPSGLAGAWRFDDGREATVAAIEHGLVLEWSENDYKCRASGRFVNRALDLAFEVEEYSIAKSERHFVDKGTAYAFPADAQTLQLLLPGSDGPRTLTKR